MASLMMCSDWRRACLDEENADEANETQQQLHNNINSATPNSRCGAQFEVVVLILIDQTKTKQAELELFVFQLKIKNNRYK